MRLISVFLAAMASHIGLAASWSSGTTYEQRGAGSVNLVPTRMVNEDTHYAVDFGSGQTAFMAYEWSKKGVPISAIEIPKALEDKDSKGSKPAEYGSILSIMQNEREAGAKKLADAIISKFQLESVPIGRTVTVFGGATAAIREHMTISETNFKEVSKFISEINIQLKSSRVHLFFSVISQDLEGYFESLSAKTLITKALSQAGGGKAPPALIASVGFGSKSTQVTFYDSEIGTTTDHKFGRNDCKTEDGLTKITTGLTGVEYLTSAYKSKKEAGMVLVAGSGVYISNYTQQGIDNITGKLVSHEVLTQHLQDVIDRKFEFLKDSRNTPEEVQLRSTKMVKAVVDKFDASTQFYFRRMFKPDETETGNDYELKTGWVTGHYIGMHDETGNVAKIVASEKNNIVAVSKSSSEETTAWKWYIHSGIGGATGLIVGLILAAVLCGGAEPIYEDEIIDEADDDSDNASVASNQSQKKNKQSKKKKNKKNKADNVNNDVDEAAEQV